MSRRTSPLSNNRHQNTLALSLSARRHSLGHAQEHLMPSHRLSTSSKDSSPTELFDALDAARFDQVRRAVQANPSCLRSHASHPSSPERPLCAIAYALAHAHTWTALLQHCRRTGLAVPHSGDLTFRERLSAMNVILVWLVSRTDVPVPWDAFPLHAALAARLDGAVGCLLQRVPALARSADARGKTPLHVVAGLPPGLPAGEAAVQVARLCAAGADACARDADGMTPLHELVRTAGTPAAAYGLVRRRARRTNNNNLESNINNNNNNNNYNNSNNSNTHNNNNSNNTNDAGPAGAAAAATVAAATAAAASATTTGGGGGGGGGGGTGSVDILGLSQALSGTRATTALEAVSSVIDALLANGGRLDVTDASGRTVVDAAFDSGLDYIVLLNRAEAIRRRVCGAEMACKWHAWRGATTHTTTTTPRSSQDFGECAHSSAGGNGAGPLWGAMPDEVVAKVMAMVGPRDAMCGLGATCRALRRVVASEFVWAHLETGRRLDALRRFVALRATPQQNA